MIWSEEMPYKRRQPAAESEMASTCAMEDNRNTGYPTICQTLRDIYAMTSDPEIRLKARLGMAMAKAMNKKLQWYKQQANNGLEHPSSGAE